MKKLNVDYLSFEWVTNEVDSNTKFASTSIGFNFGFDKKLNETEIEECKKNFKYDLKYSFNKSLWKKYKIGENIKLDLKHKKVYFKGINPTLNSDKVWIQFTSISENSDMYNSIIVDGNIMSIVDYQKDVTTIPTPYYFYKFFSGSDIISTPKLPATELTVGCYTNMFADCELLVSVHDLPAKVMKPFCYAYMFSNTRVITTPNICGETLDEYCYWNMFSKCKSLVYIKPFNVKDLKMGSCSNMFSDCPCLVDIPQLIFGTWEELSCESMFENCTSIKNFKWHITGDKKKYSCLNMFSHCMSLETPPVLQGDVDRYCYEGMFVGCQSLKRAPALPKLYFKENKDKYVGCFRFMFADCNIKKAPSFDFRWEDKTKMTFEYMKEEMLIDGILLNNEIVEFCKNTSEEILECATSIPQYIILEQNNPRE